jgi:hypothetical protein
MPSISTEPHRTPRKLGVDIFGGDPNKSLAKKSGKNNSSKLGKPDQMPSALGKGKSLDEIKRDLRTGDAKIMNLMGIGSDPPRTRPVVEYYDPNDERPIRQSVFNRSPSTGK